MKRYNGLDTRGRTGNEVPARTGPGSARGMTIIDPAGPQPKEPGAPEPQPGGRPEPVTPILPDPTPQPDPEPQDEPV